MNRCRKTAVHAAPPVQVSHTVHLQTTCIHIELSHAPISLMPRFMARLGGLADKLWHNGGLYSERSTEEDPDSPCSRAVVVLKVPAMPHAKPVVEVQCSGDVGLAWCECHADDSPLLL